MPFTFSLFLSSDDSGPEGADQVTICRNIVNGRVEFPGGISITEAAKDLIRKLLTKDPSKRVGCLKKGADEIKSHGWFAGESLAN